MTTHVLTHKQIILHLVTHLFKKLASLQLRLSRLNDSKEGDPEVRKLEIVALSTETIELLSTLEPALTLALKELPEFHLWVVSAQEAILRIKADNGILGNICECKGCSPEGCSPEHTSVEGCNDKL